MWRLVHCIALHCMMHCGTADLFLSLAVPCAVFGEDLAGVAARSESIARHTEAALHRIHPCNSWLGVIHPLLPERCGCGRTGILRHSTGSIHQHVAVGCWGTAMQATGSSSSVGSH
jgi:hypothetical protein